MGAPGRFRYTEPILKAGRTTVPQHPYTALAARPMPPLSADFRFAG